MLHSSKPQQHAYHPFALSETACSRHPNAQWISRSCGVLGITVMWYAWDYSSIRCPSTSETIHGRPRWKLKESRPQRLRAQVCVERDQYISAGGLRNKQSFMASEQYSPFVSANALKSSCAASKSCPPLCSLSLIFFGKQSARAPPFDLLDFSRERMRGRINH